MSPFKSLVWFMLLLVAVWSTGCESRSTAVTSADNSTPALESGITTAAAFPAGNITVVGDDSAREVAAEIRKQGLGTEENTAAVSSAAIVVVAEDATAGIRDSHRKLVQSLAKNREVSVVWVLTRMSQINDAELVELIKQEVRDLLKEHGATKLGLTFAVDTEQTTVDGETLKGWRSITQFLAKQGRRT